MKILILFVSALALANASVIFRHKRSAQNEYKMCVPEDLLASCQEMAGQATKSSVRIICVPARDRMECLEKVKEHQADFVRVDPEDMLIAGKISDDDFAVFEEIRTLEEPDAEFRYEGVAIVRKDLNITSIDQIKGLKSCHTGVGRMVGYRVPLTKLSNMGIIGKLNDPNLTPRENELKTYSELFSKACIVGKWSADPKLDRELKNRYSNLCQMCEEPTKCDYPDKFSGYDGVVRCLVHNHADIGWTKAIFVKRFFGLPIGTTPAKPNKERPEDYAYLCPDGTKVPVTGPPCKWMARPWQGYMANAAITNKVDELSKKIENLDVLGHKNKAEWLTKVLEIQEQDVARQSKTVLSPNHYIEKANWVDIAERDYGPPFKRIRFCVVTDEEKKKCTTLTQLAFPRHVRPKFDCVQQKSVDDCLQAIKDNKADIITLDGGLVDTAQRDYNLKPIVAEKYGPLGGSYYAVAVVRKNSPYQSFADLRGAKSCHTGVGRTAGYNAPLYTLLKLNLIKKDQCPYPKAIHEFFSGGSCMPGARDPKYNLGKADVDGLCSLCAGNKEKGDTTTKCNFDQSESYSGYTGAFRCLVEGGGDVAFVKHVTVPGNTDGKNKEQWAEHLKSSDYELLCPNGGRAAVDQFEKCHLTRAPPHMVVTSKSKSEQEIEEIQNALITAADMFVKRPDWFKLFGSFEGKKDLLFKDSATGLFKVDDQLVMEEYSKVLEAVNGCRNT